MSIRKYFRPSYGHSKPTGFISVALKSREQGTSSARSAEYFLRPVTVHSTVATSPSQKQRTHPRYLSRQMSYDSSSFTATAYRLEAYRLRAKMRFLISYGLNLDIPNFHAIGPASFILYQWQLMNCTSAC